MRLTRKFYMFVLAMLCVASTAMALPGGRTVNLNVKKAQSVSAKTIDQKNVPTASVKNAEAAPAKVNASKLAGKKLTGMRKADANNASIEGTWTFALDDSYLNNSSGTTIYVDYDATLDGTELLFEDLSGEELPFVAVFNAATNKLTFNREYLGSTGTYYVYQQTYNYLVGLDPQSIQATFSPSEGKISFSNYNLLGWEACSDEAGTNKLGYFGLYGLSEAVVSTAWKDLGEASFINNIVSGLFGVNQTIPTTHQIFASTENPGVYKVLDPFSDIYSNLGISSTSPQMIIDASDPANVKIEMQSSGINASSGSTSLGVLYYFNEGWYCAEYGEELDPTLVCTLTKSDDGIATITIPYHSTTIYAATSKGYYYGSAYESVLKFQLPEGEGEVDTDTPVVNSIYYLLNREDKTAQVTGCASTLTNLNVPETIEVTSGTYTVTSVAASAFQGNKTITSITIPATITEIGTDAFRNLTNLKTLNIADMAAWCAINFANGNANPLYNVFPTSASKWGKVYVAGEEVSTTLVIPEGVTEIGRAFYGFKSLTSVTLPSTLVTLGDQVFANCEGLTEMVIPEGVTTMGSVFFGCKKLTSVTLPSTLETLKGSTFYSCNLTEVTLPASLKTMGSMIFSSNYNLAKVTCYAVEPPTITGYMVFEDDAFDGELYVPETSVDAYKAAGTWKEFKNVIGFEVPEGDFGDATIEGDWKFTLDWHYAGAYSLGVQTETYTATLDGNTVTFKSPYDDFNIVAKFTAENTLTFHTAAVGDPASQTKTQNPFTDGTKVTDAGIDAENFVFKSFTATYDSEAGTITFPEGVGLAYGYADASGVFSYYEDAFDFIAAKKADAEEPAVRRWDFTSWSDETVDNLKADAAEGATTGWSDDEKNDGKTVEGCFWASNTMEADEIYGLSANKVVINELKGLKFTGALDSRNLAIAVNYQTTNLGTYKGGSYLWLGGANKKFFTIPAVKAGSKIKMGVESHKPTEGRGVELYIGDVKIDGPDVPSAYEEQEWTVPEGETANIIVNNTNGCHIYFIEVEQDQEALLAIVKEDLATVIAAVEAINPDDYTAETIAVLIDALATASNIGDDATADEIAEATYALLNAKAALVKTEPEKPFAYTVKEVYGDIVFRTTEGEDVDGATVKVPYRMYNADDEGKLYKKAKQSSGTYKNQFNYGFTLKSDGQEESIEYSATDVENVVFLAEAEDIETLTLCAGEDAANSLIRSSNSAAAYAAEDADIVTLPAGKYKLHAVIFDASKNPSSVWVFRAGEEEIASFTCKTVNLEEFDSEEFTLAKETTVVMAQAGSNKMGLDLVYVVKTGDYDPAGITSVETERENGNVYNLQGQKVTKAQKGIFIINGKKVVLK